jgi:hypothetical protein
MRTHRDAIAARRAVVGEKPEKMKSRTRIVLEMILETARILKTHPVEGTLWICIAALIWSLD